MGTRADPAVEVLSPEVEERSQSPMALRARDPAPRALAMTPAQVIALQRSAGNQAVLRAMRSSSNGQIQREPAGPPAPPGLAPAPPGPGGAAPARPAGSVDPALSFIADYARKVPGYTLVAHAVGADPITGQPVPGSLVKEIVALIPGGAALMERLEQSGVLPKASAWLSDEIGKLGLTFDTIAGLFKQAWDSISAWDLFDPAAAWSRLSKIFDPPIAKVTAFAERAAEKLFEFSLEAMLAAGGGAASQVMVVLKRAGQAFGQIVKDPIGFASNLVAAVKGGFAAFASNIGTHLQKGLFGWLTGALKGAITLPQKLDFEGIISLALQVLGLTWDRIRQRLVKMVGERTVAMAERAVSFVKDIADRGLGVVWEKMAEFAGNLADTVIGGIRDWVAESVVGAAIKRLVTMFNPAGAIINAVLAVYNTIEFVIERAKQLGELIDAVSTSISEIASGAIGRAVIAVENALSRAVPVAIGFLAQLLGLDGIGDKIREVIEKVRGAVDNAIDKVINWIVSKFHGGKKEEDEPAGATGEGEEPEEPIQAGKEKHKLWLELDGPKPAVMIASDPQDIDHLFAKIRAELDGEEEPTKQAVEAKIQTAIAQKDKAEVSKAKEDVHALAVTVQELVDVKSSRNVGVNDKELLAEYERLADKKLPWMLDLVLAKHASTPTAARQTLVKLEADFRKLMATVPQGAELTAKQRADATDILREARELARKDFSNVQQAVWEHLRGDEDLKKIEAKMVAKGDVGPGEAALRIGTMRTSGKGYGSMDLEHSARLSDQPLRYNERNNLMVTDAFQNQQFNEALRKHGKVWATDELEAFVIFHRLNDQGIDFMPGRG